MDYQAIHRRRFPFLFGRAFIEATTDTVRWLDYPGFPSFSEGLSLRHYICKVERGGKPRFPFLFGRAFIEALRRRRWRRRNISVSLPFRKGFH